jgi:hypothetical protein
LEKPTNRFVLRWLVGRLACNVVLPLANGFGRVSSRGGRWLGVRCLRRTVVGTGMETGCPRPLRGIRAPFRGGRRGFSNNVCAFIAEHERESITIPGADLVPVFTLRAPWPCLVTPGLPRPARKAPFAWFSTVDHLDSSGCQALWCTKGDFRERLALNLVLAKPSDKDLAEKGSCCHLVQA